jgi:ParB family chromosome partitioning protein
MGTRFSQYEYVKVPKKNGGKVFIAVSHDGAIEVFDGWLSQKEAKKRAKQTERETSKSEVKSAMPGGGAVVTRALQNYFDLHRHAVVRLALIANPNVTFRLAVAHMAAASGNWNVKPDPQTSRNPAIRASIENSVAQAEFADEEQAIYALLDWQADDDEDVFVRHETCDVFARLLDLPDADVQRIAAFFMARSLACGSAAVEDVGVRLGVDARTHWRADETFFDLIRDRATVNALLAEVAGEAVAKTNIAEKAKIQKQIVRDSLTGANGRAKVDGWLPGWMAFPERGIRQAVPGDTADAEGIAAE